MLFLSDNLYWFRNFEPVCRFSIKIKRFYKREATFL